jgi:hypothetical protein
MKRWLLLTTLLALFTTWTYGQIVYEDFEGGAQLTWTSINGSFDGVVANPDPNAINASNDVGAYTNDPGFDFNFCLADLGTPLDLSVNNQFKVSIYAAAPTQVLLKLEGTGGFIEATKNIAVTNAWQEYTFDFRDAAANTGLTKILLVFAPGELGSSDTYLFDNLRAEPLGDCEGVPLVPTMIDDFECNRNATYGGGWDSLSVVDNPDISPENPTAQVGRFADQAGPGTEWGALVIDYQNDLDLSVNNNLRVKIWSPKVGDILFKLEGGLSPVKEIFQTVPSANEWVTYTVDFSSEAAASHKKIVFFFNAGVNGEPGDVYFIDEIEWTEAPDLPPLEDFEDGAALFWQPLNGNASAHGTFNGPTANPAPGGVNESDFVGCYTKGLSPTSTLQALLAPGFSLAGYPQLNLDVWAPAGSEEVIMRLFSPTQGNKDVTREITATEEWITLNFDFSEHEGITDFSSLQLIFDSGTAAEGTTYCIDNLTQSTSTVDPCEGIDPIPNIVDDYECQRNYNVYYGADFLEVINNRDLSTVNSSAKVGKFDDPANDPWAGLGYETAAPIDLSVFNQLSVQIWASAAVPVLFKLEGGSGAVTEVWQDITVTNEWVNYLIDFSAPAGSDYTKLVIFFDGGNEDPNANTYYIDNIRWRRLSYNGCVDDHETVPTTISNWKYFANGYLEAAGYQFEIIDNPNPSGINVSDKVGKFLRAGDALPFAGMYADLDAPIEFKDNRSIRIKVHMDHIGNVALKLEGSLTGAGVIEVPVENTKTNEWEEITVPFPTAEDDAQYARLTLFFDLGIDATGEDVASYFDDIVIGDGDCTPVNVFEMPQVEYFRIAPNPASSYVRIENAEIAEHVVILDAIGRPVVRMRTYGEQDVQLDIANLPPGLYLLAGYNQVGALVANGKFVKN